MRFTYVSESYSTHTGLPTSEIIGKTRNEMRAGKPAVERSADWAWLHEKIAAREPFEDFIFLSYGCQDEDDPVWVRIALTANAMSHQVSEYIMNGFDTYVSKPFRMDELIRAIGALAGR
ncbi:hypothetical protein [Actibacterium sp. MT2.3-13A]|uniref:hypothetical protein n=1 Tax=Actibacterium sp. MT2.3-13A TaxID=2828332 RepID=UPI001BA8E444|nr:hypothetical protein [Actibacterium sp. MT2.3-13A]